MSTFTRRQLIRGLLAASIVPSTPAGFGSESRALSGRGTASATVEAVVLGTAQDAGVPQVNCFEGFCRRVRSGAAPSPRVASLGVVDAATHRRYLFDATPDVVAQLGLLLGDRVPADVVRLADHLDGVFLTHAHIGHYTGLAQFGREAAATDGLTLYVSSEMSAFLEDNEPWATLVRAGHVEPRLVEPGRPVRSGDDLEVTPVPVAHRADLSDTMAYMVAGRERRLLYVPDADTWEGWPLWSFEQCLERVDVALLDGTFWSHDELGYRPQGEVPHPPVRRTLTRLEGLPDLPEIRFVHLNHTNPLWDPGSAERRRLADAGFGVATEGQRWSL